MKGLVFTLLVEMVEDTFGYETVEKIMDKCGFDENKSFTSVGNYPTEDLVKMVQSLSELKSLDVDTLLYKFGLYMHTAFIDKFSDFYKNQTNVFDFLSSVDSHIHIEVKKLYPDAYTPKFKTKMVNERQMEMVYQSKNKFSALAHGLIKASADYYQDNIHIEKISLDERSEQGHCKFILTRV